MRTQSQSNTRYQELDALRGIAALLVVFFHFTSGKPQYNSFFKLGTTGVDLFFIISGFVIFMSLQKISRSSDFVINRISRLYPTYWACVTLTFILVVSHSSINHIGNYNDLIISYLGNLTMFQFYLKIPNLDGPYWTLIIEMLFYIGIYILYRLKCINYLNIIGILICLTVVIMTQYFYDITAVRKIISGIPLLQFIPLFLAGITFYKIYTLKNQLFYNYLIILTCYLCQIALFPYSGGSKYYIEWTEYSVMLSIYFVIFILFVNNNLRFIVTKTTLFLGKISYALYLIHQFISLSIIIPFFFDHLKINFWVVTLLINLPIIIGLAALITYKIEIPFSKKMKEKLKTSNYPIFKRI